MSKFKIVNFSPFQHCYFMANLASFTMLELSINEELLNDVNAKHFAKIPSESFLTKNCLKIRNLKWKRKGVFYCFAPARYKNAAVIFSCFAWEIFRIWIHPHWKFTTVLPISLSLSNVLSSHDRPCNPTLNNVSVMAHKSRLLMSDSYQMICLMCLYAL